LWNDYGSVQREQIAGHAASQRFGPTSALGLNFPYLEHFFTSRGRLVVKPDDDERRSIHARMLLLASMPRSIAAFQNRFGPAGNDFFDGPLEDARKHAAAGRKNDALECYRTALSRSPRDWQVAGEIAEFVGLHLQDYAAGQELAKAAVELNPWYSPWVWNILGDVLFLDGRVDDAHEAYLQAHRIHPADARTNLNLAYSYFEFGQHGAALEAIAVALAADVRGLYRHRLLEKQHQILGAISGRWLGEQERLARRAERML
jgi:tetratricopeptide (TPR) repeat protein